MAERVTGGTFGNPGAGHRLLDCPLDNRFIDVMPSLLTGIPVPPSTFLRENPLPAPISRRVGILSRECVWHEYPAIPFDPNHADALPSPI